MTPLAMEITEVRSYDAVRRLCTKMIIGLAFLFTLMSPAVANSADNNFPNSHLVLDFIALSNAVYKLKNTVASCQDPEANNPTLVASTREELLGAYWDESEDGNLIKQQYMRRLRDNVEGTGNLFDTLLPDGVICLHYSHDHYLGTQVLVVRSFRQNYVSVVYAGTDDFTTALMDGEVLMDKFGPASNSTNYDASELQNVITQVPEEAHVHRGFNKAVFDSTYFAEVLDCVASAKSGGSCNGADERHNEQMIDSEPLRLYTSGHSLGAANSVLLGATLHLLYPEEQIQSINFGCPKIGNAEFSSWIDTLKPGQSNADGSLEVFRFVNKLDLVPRLPDLIFFYHAGHTLQMSVGGEIRAYYNHVGDLDVGYAAVPFGWGAEPYVLFPVAIYEHHHKRYLEYLIDYAPQSNSSEKDSMYFVYEFERVDEDLSAQTSPSVLIE